jgi:hypothetical protein
MKKSVLFISAMFAWMGVFSQTDLPQSAVPREQFTATLYPVNMTDGTGYITSYLPAGPFLKKGPWMNVSATVNDTLGRGYMKFDISSLPADAVITWAALNYYNFYREPTSYDNSKIYPLAHDPVTTSGSALFYDCADGVSLWEGQWGDEGTTDPTWINSMLNPGGIEYISDQLAAGWAGFGIVAGYENFARFSGYDDPIYRPWLEIEYYIPTTPLFSVSPVSANFGQVNLGIQSLPQVFKIKNIGIGTVTVEELILHGDDAINFVLADNAVYPKNLGAGESYTVSVAFKPASTGYKTATLRITENETLQDFTLTGAGYLNGPLDLKATPVFGPYVDLSWVPPLPLAEIRYDDNFAMGYTYLQVSTTSDYYYTRITIPADGTLTNIGVYTNALSSPAAFESLSLCPDLDGFPDISSPIRSFPDVGVLSTGYAWILQPLNPLEVTAGQNYYIVTQCKDYETGGLSLAISESNSNRCGWTRNGDWYGILSLSVYLCGLT